MDLAYSKLDKGGDIMADDSNQNKGFASMDEEEQKKIASKGGQAAHDKGTAHEFDSQEAEEAGKKGGQAAHPHGRGLQNADKATREEVAREGGES